ncbi:hypothetical protein Tco_0387565, partial [Tanacetum coccineum]
HTALFEHKCEHHPSGIETKNSWFEKKQSSDEGSRGMDQRWYCKAGAVSDLDLQSSSSKEGRRHLEDLHRLQECKLGMSKGLLPHTRNRSKDRGSNRIPF